MEGGKKGQKTKDKKRGKREKRKKGENITHLPVIQHLNETHFVWDPDFSKVANRLESSILKQKRERKGKKETGASQISSCVF
jgi:hypothetical protein